MRDSPIDDAILVKVLECKQHFGGVELSPPRCKLFALDVEHEVSARDVLHDKVDASLGLETRVQSEEERMSLACSSEEDPLLRLCPADPTASEQASRCRSEGLTTRPRRSQ